jgi:hypothetical protein
LNVGVQLRDPNVPVFGFLSDPHGEPLDAQSTQFIDNTGNTQTGNTLQFFHRAPERGRWTLSLSVRGPLDGTHLSTPFTGTIGFQAAKITTHGLPDSERAQLAAGQSVTASIDVTNTGNSTKLFFADPRLQGRQLVGLAGSGVTGVPLPLSLATQPLWLVPPHSDRLIIAAQGTVPIVMDVSQPFGDPERKGVALPGNFSVATVASSEVAPTVWFALPEMRGPFPPNGQQGSANLAALAHTNPFDTSIVPDTGDFWLQAVDPNAADSFAPIILNPGQTGRITLTITPSGSRGSVVRGFIGVDAIDLFTDSGDELDNVHYSYAIK